MCDETSEAVYHLMQEPIGEVVPDTDSVLNTPDDINNRTSQADENAIPIVNC